MIVGPSPLGSARRLALASCVYRKPDPDLSVNRIGEVGAMIALIWFVLAPPFRSKSWLEAENAVLRHQLIRLAA
jgi:hypothetical protein